MNYLYFVLALYVLLALILYVRYETTDHVSKKGRPPRRYIRFALPWYYNLANPRSTWFFSYWNNRRARGYSEWGIRVLGFEYWVEFWR